MIVLHDSNAELLVKLSTTFSSHPCENLHLESTRDLFIELRNITDHLDSRVCRSDIVKILDEEKFLSYYKKCLDYFVAEPKLSALTNSKSPQVINFLKLHGLLWNICRQKYTESYWVCEKLGSNSVHLLLWRFVCCRHLVATKCVQHPRLKLLVYLSFGILLNILTRTPVSVGDYRSCNGVHILRPFISESKVRGAKPADDLKMAAILLLISIVNEKENKSINSTENYVSYLLSALRTALQSPDFYSSNHRHHLHDLIRGLNKLTRFDANKRLLLEGEILGDISKMLSIAKNLQNSKPDEFSQNPVSHVDPNKLATEVVRLLWQLCFLSETREQLLQDTSLIALCRDLNASSFSTTFREAVEGLFWSLSKPLKDFETAGSLNSSPLSTTANPYGHIVFACSRTNHHRVIDDLKLALRDRGYNVYIESDRMHMEDALADASALILCLSYSFSTSPFCRQQVLSALSHRVALIPVLLESNYEPEAWLHYLLATVIYTSFTDRDDPEQATEFLSLALAKYGIVRQTCDVDGALLNEPPHALVASPEAVAFQRPKSACGSEPSSATSRMTSTPSYLTFSPKSVMQSCNFQFLAADSSNSSTPTPSKCATQANLQDLQPPPFSRCSPTHTSESRLESSSYSVSQMSSMWSHCEESATSSKLEDSAIALAYQAPSAEIKSWSASRVRRWLEENGLSNYAPALLWLDGTLLWELAWHRIRSCDSFFCNLDYHLKMPPQDQMTFYNALSLLRDAT